MAHAIFDLSSHGVSDHVGDVLAAAAEDNHLLVLRALENMGDDGLAAGWIGKQSAGLDNHGVRRGASTAIPLVMAARRSASSPLA
ncbi:hypothetical protein [Muricoccus vinaceus]|uniref:Uncharacterized protein n=1 Tax=Muricoccus vinaceus TaxID=424704 RepID=A0ABV6J2F7_9PROT